MKKKVLVWATLAVMSLGALTGCQKKVECDWCGETKVCKEYNDGEDVWNIPIIINVYRYAWNRTGVPPVLSV